MHTLLVPIDFSRVTQAVVDAASALAKHPKSKIILAHVVRPPVLVAEYGGAVPASAEYQEDSDRAAAGLLARWEAVLTRRKIRVEGVLINGVPAPEIVRLAKKRRADMVVMGSHGHTAIYDLLIGGTASGVLRGAHCPVLIVPTAAKPKRR